MNHTSQKIGSHPPLTSAGNPLVVITRLLTDLGPMLAVATETGICLLEFVEKPRIETQLSTVKRLFRTDPVSGTSPHFERLQSQLTEYFEGQRKEFTVPLDIPGTEFQTKVWHALQKIPYGKTRTYSDQAVAINRPTAVRAVAKANGDNRIAIIIPCHRVIGKSGELVGYGGGLWRKKHLLELEAKTCSR